MNLWSKIADSLILEASRGPIDPEDRQRKLIDTPHGKVEAWIIREEFAESDQEIFALKFPGTGGRAERGGSHPCDAWDDISHEVWTINPPGYGGSEGNASLAKMPAVIEACCDAIVEASAGKPVYTIGNSLGCLYALYAANRIPVAGVFLRNPLPLAELIIGRYSWWNFGVFSRAIAKQVPGELNAIENARRSKSPAFFVMSAADRLVPPEYQYQIINAYAGNTHVYTVDGADHHEPPGEDELEQYQERLQWLLDHRA